MNTKVLVQAIGIVLSGISLNTNAINNAPADADTVTLRTSCTENNGATEIPNCFTTMDQVNNWLLNARQLAEQKATVIDVGPGIFDAWKCQSANITLRGSGRDRTVFVPSDQAFMTGMRIDPGCTNLNVQDMAFDASGAGTGAWGIQVKNPEAITSWTNVDIIGPAYGWIETPTTCPATRIGKHIWFSSRIRATGSNGVFNNATRAYIAKCTQSWFWGSEITAEEKDVSSSSFAIEAHDAEIHLYGSNARLLINQYTAAQELTPTNGSFIGNYLIAALDGSAIHIHGTGLDIMHPGTGTADMLYADSTSHFHANESGFNIHVSGAGKVRRIGGSGSIEAPYIWKQGTQPPLSASANSISTLISVNGADSYIETDCPVTGDCSLGGSFPHQMIYRAECAGTSANQGPWFDLTTKACRQ